MSTVVLVALVWAVLSVAFGLLVGRFIRTGQTAAPAAAAPVTAAPVTIGAYRVHADQTVAPERIEHLDRVA